MKWRFATATSGCERWSWELKPATYILNIVWRQRSSLWASHATVFRKGLYYEISAYSSIGESLLFIQISSSDIWSTYHHETIWYPVKTKDELIKGLPFCWRAECFKFSSSFFPTDVLSVDHMLNKGIWLLRNFFCFRGHMAIFCFFFAPKPIFSILVNGELMKKEAQWWVVWFEATQYGFTDLVLSYWPYQSTVLVPETKDKTKEYKEVTGGRSDQSLNSLTIQ